MSDVPCSKSSLPVPSITESYSDVGLSQNNSFSGNLTMCKISSLVSPSPFRSVFPSSSSNTPNNTILPSSIRSKEKNEVGEEARTANR